jgi:hypothetical protein
MTIISGEREREWSQFVITALHLQFPESDPHWVKKRIAWKSSSVGHSCRIRVRSCAEQGKLPRRSLREVGLDGGVFTPWGLGLGTWKPWAENEGEAFVFSGALEYLV